MSVMMEDNNEHYDGSIIMSVMMEYNNERYDGG